MFSDQLEYYLAPLTTTNNVTVGSFKTLFTPVIYRVKTFCCAVVDLALKFQAFFSFFKTLTWSLHNYPALYVGLSRADVDRTLDKAFKMWQSVAQLNFQRLNNNNHQADIVIMFQSGLHNDPYPFDGRGGTLAHGFYPGSNSGKYKLRGVFFQLLQKDIKSKETGDIKLQRDKK